ncbi:hypothetical protein IV203_011830 [Nitzschia inconspicua]|uniref:Uncharacterized protein n=1 Tax=Nitzschia inconspicua TaxID=303405 RepID=A0A9K3KUD8_9STRA|nr:hypothetical protein IV203_011830 [Nitzschia inconspicua]
MPTLASDILKKSLNIPKDVPFSKLTSRSYVQHSRQAIHTSSKDLSIHIKLSHLPKRRTSLSVFTELAHSE